MNVPILFLVFNRPAQTTRVFETIRQARPQRLFVAADGPRPGRAGEGALCAETRRLATAIDWPCEIKTLFRETNLGCGAAVSGAISWFFENVEEGIILEDDCLPNPDFFKFCAVMLERYRDNEKVGTIGGVHCLPAELEMNRSHYASKYFQMWGWASWRRFWQHYDFSMSTATDQGWRDIFRATHPVQLEAKFWHLIYQKLKSGGFDTWDFQVCFTAWQQRAVHIMPSKNLVSNLGYGSDATHTNFASQMSELSTFPLEVNDVLPQLEPKPQIDDLIFYVRYLDSLGYTFWLEQLTAPDERLTEARNELSRTTRKLKQLENEITEKRRQLRDAVQAIANDDSRSHLAPVAP